LNYTRINKYLNEILAVISSLLILPPNLYALNLVSKLWQFSA